MPFAVGTCGISSVSETAGSQNAPGPSRRSDLPHFNRSVSAPSAVADWREDDKLIGHEN